MASADNLTIPMSTFVLMCTAWIDERDDTLSSQPSLTRGSQKLRERAAVGMDGGRRHGPASTCAYVRTYVPLVFPSMAFPPVFARLPSTTITRVLRMDSHYELPVSQFSSDSTQGTSKYSTG
jgi:hypothetical protein